LNSEIEVVEVEEVEEVEAGWKEDSSLTQLMITLL
jgi:hypothetical protein